MANKTLTINLDKSLIFEAVKVDTFVTGQADKAQDAVGNSAMAYNEQAGEDTHHMRKLERIIGSAVAALETQFAEFADSSSENSVSDTLQNATETKTDFQIIIKVTSRYNSGLAFPISRLAQDYIVNKMLYYWWQPIKPQLAKDFLEFSNESLMNIRKCMAKTAPAESATSYNNVSGSVS